MGGRGKKRWRTSASNPCRNPSESLPPTPCSILKVTLSHCQQWLTDTLQQSRVGLY